MVTDLKSITDVIGDGLHGTPEYDENGQFYFINGNNLNETIEIKSDTKRVNEDEYNKYKKPLNSNTILLSINGTLGNFARYNNEPVILGKSACYINIKKGYNVDYISWFLKSKVKSDFERNATGTTIKNISLKQIREFQINLPDDVVQEKIANILNAIQGKIDVNNKINRNLTHQFVAFVDNFIHQLDTFELKRLDEVADCQNGRAFYKEGYDDEGAFVIDLGNVNTSANFVYTNVDKYVSMERYVTEKLEKYRVYKDDLVMVMTDRKSTMDLLGKTGKIYKEGFYLLNQRMYRIRANEDMNVNYLYAVLNSSKVCNGLKEKALGSVQKYVNTKEIKEIEVIVPSLEKMQELSDIINPISSRMETNILENEVLTKLRDELLPKLMSGELDVSELDI